MCQSMNLEVFLKAYVVALEIAQSYETIFGQFSHLDVKGDRENFDDLEVLSAVASSVRASTGVRPSDKIITVLLNEVYMSEMNRQFSNTVQHICSFDTIELLAKDIVEQMRDVPRVQPSVK